MKIFSLCNTLKERSNTTNGIRYHNLKRTFGVFDRIVENILEWWQRFCNVGGKAPYSLMVVTFPLHSVLTLMSLVLFLAEELIHMVSYYSNQCHCLVKIFVRFAAHLFPCQRERE